MACRLPGRAAPLQGAELLQAVDVLEDELLSCATQVLDCIRTQEANAHAATK